MKHLAMLVFGLIGTLHAADPAWLKTGEFHWKCSPPLIGPDETAADPDVALKDPTMVFHEGTWHLFATHRRASGKVDMQYLSFADWKDADKATRHTLDFHDQYHCAPQVFFFTPHQRWYLIYQLADEKRPLKFGPYFSTTTNIADPKSWTKPQPMIETLPEGGTKTKWIDFWVICDATKAHLLYTSDDGHFWRRETQKQNFPLGWSKPELLLQDTKEALFEASCTYKLKGRDQFLTIIEALGSGHRYYKAWLADKIEGPWKPLAATRDKPFAAANQLTPFDWTNSISHGELIRSSNGETLEIDPAKLRFVFQGVDDEGYKAKKYGSIPWKIGILEQRPPVLSIEEQLKRIIIPQVSFEDATLEEAVEYLHYRGVCIDSPDDGPRTVNTIVIPEDSETKASISLDLRDVTMGDVLRKIAAMAGKKLTVHPSAVILSAIEVKLPSWKPIPGLNADEIIFPVVQFQKATLEEAVEYFRVKSRFHDPKQAGVEIRIKSGISTKPVITLDVRQTPLPEALMYSAWLAGYKVEVVGQDFLLTPLSKD